MEYSLFENVPIVSDEQIEQEHLRCYPSITIRPNALNQKISERLLREKRLPDIFELYSERNLVSLAKMLKKDIHNQLQKDMDSVCTINQLINVIIVMENFQKGNNPISYEKINQMKEVSQIENWTLLPFTREDYNEWKKNHISEKPRLEEATKKRIRQKKEVIEEAMKEALFRQFEPQYEVVPYAGTFSKGEYNDILYRWLLIAFLKT